GFRIAIFAVFFALVGFFFIRPLRQRVSDLQVALFVEESEPSLQAAILAAVDAGGLGEGTGGALSAEVHPVILERMIQQAIEKCRQANIATRVGQPAVKRNSMVLGAIAVVA